MKGFGKFLICSLVAFQVYTLNECYSSYNQIKILQSNIEQYKSQISSSRQLIKEKDEKIKEYSDDISNYIHENVAYEKREIEIESENQRKTVAFDATDLRVPSCVTADDLAYALAGTKLEHLAPAYVKLEQDYGWNAIAAASITAHETYWGNDYKATDYNNLGGVRKGDGSYRVFSSQDEFVDYLGSFINRLYLSDDGLYHLGYGLKDINVNYCPVGGTVWSDSIAQIGEGLEKEINSRED